MNGAFRLDRVAIALCITEVVSWGTLYYALPAGAAGIARDTGWTLLHITTAFSLGLVVSAIAGIGAGRLLDRLGPRLVMTGGTLLGVAGMAIVATAPTLPVFFVGWVVIGLAQSAVFYQAAFTVLGRHYIEPARGRALLAVTLLGGLASTIYAPLTLLLEQAWGWRVAFLVLTGAMLLITAPLHSLLLPRRWPAADTDAPPAASRVVRTRRFVLLAIGLALVAFAMYGTTINTIPLLRSRNVDTATATLGLALVGVGQVAGRILITALNRHIGRRWRAAAVTAIATVTLLPLAFVPGPGALLCAFALVAGSARGALTLVQATAVIDRWGTTRLGTLNGALGLTVTLATAVAPVAAVGIATALGAFPIAIAILAGIALLGCAAVVVVDSRRLAVHR